MASSLFGGERRGEGGREGGNMMGLEEAEGASATPVARFRQGFVGPRAPPPARCCSPLLLLPSPRRAYAAYAEAYEPWGGACRSPSHPHVSGTPRPSPPFLFPCGPGAAASGGRGGGGGGRGRRGTGLGFGNRLLVCTLSSSIGRVLFLLGLWTGNKGGT
jgi:hypothetical protein